MLNFFSGLGVGLAIAVIAGIMAFRKGRRARVAEDGEVLKVQHIEEPPTAGYFKFHLVRSNGEKLPAPILVSVKKAGKFNVGATVRVVGGELISA